MFWTRVLYYGPRLNPMNRQPRHTQKERKAVHGPGPKPPATRAGGEIYDADARSIPLSPDVPAGQHLHCVACGKHLDTVGEARDRAAKGITSNLWMSIRCAHGSIFYACMGCLEPAQKLLDDHDRTGDGVRAATPWH